MDGLINEKGNCIVEKHVIKYNEILHKKIIDYNSNFSGITWTCKVFNYINNIKNLPRCPVCGKLVKFHTLKNGYKKYCSIKCAANSSEFCSKRKNTILQKFGVKNVSQNNIIKNKKRITLLKNYGVDHPLKSNEIKNRIIQTNQKHWGVKNVSQSKQVQDFKKKTMLDKYNHEYGFQSNEIKEKIKKTVNNKYGVDYYVQSKENKKIIKNSINSKRINFWSNLLNINISDITIIGNNFIIKNYCPIHNCFEINRYILYNRKIVGKVENICTLCNPVIEQSSIKEKELNEFIVNELNIKTEKIRINNKEIDIYLPNYKLGIEFDGLYWHSTEYKDKNYHINKTELCEQQGIQLLHVFEDEWINKKEIVKSIINAKLGLTNIKIYARKCEISEINSKVSSEFLNRNHMQGNVNSKIKLGLFYNNEIVSLMTFGKKRIALGEKTQNIDGEYEMLRFCNKINTQVIGGASKLLKYFIKTYNPKSILTFADRRYSNGNLYKQLGFKFIHNTKPNYWYFKTSEMIRHYRYSFRKDLLIKNGYDINKTEYEIMAERGYLRIYDSGNMKFEMKI